MRSVLDVEVRSASLPHVLAVERASALKRSPQIDHLTPFFENLLRRTFELDGD